jgi:hypothetical protein
VAGGDGPRHRSAYGIGYRTNAPGKRGRVRSIANDGDTTTRDAALELWGDRPALAFGSWKRAKPAATRMVLYWDTKGALGMGDLSLPWRNSTQEIYVLGRGFLGRRTGNVLRFPPVQAVGRHHPHEKPVDLMLALLQCCPPGLVADPFAGSGATLVAAKLLGRRAVGVELNAAHCATIARRLAQETLDLGGAA